MGGVDVDEIYMKVMDANKLKRLKPYFKKVRKPWPANPEVLTLTLQA